MYVKAEYFNPASSVKDRLAVNIIEEAEIEGHLSKGQTVVEATSGNTGMGLALASIVKGYKLIFSHRNPNNKYRHANIEKNKNFCLLY